MSETKWTLQLYHDVLDEWLDAGDEEFWYNVLEHGELLQADYPDLCLRIKRTITRQESTLFDLDDELFAQMKEIAIKGAQLQYLRGLLEEADIEWTAHNDLVEAARRDLAVFFDVECTPSGFEQYRHMWNLVGFYVLISRLRARLPAIVVSAEEFIEAKKRGSELYQELFEENPEQEALRQLEADFYEEYGGLDSRDPNW